MSIPEPEPESDAEDAFVFAPVLSRPRYDGWTDQRQRVFIAGLSRHASVAHAARAVGKTTKSARRLRTRDAVAEFTRAWDDALEVGHARTIHHAIALAFAGEAVPHYWRGRKLGERRRYDTRLLIALVRRLSPA